MVQGSSGPGSGRPSKVLKQSGESRGEAAGEPGVAEPRGEARAEPAEAPTEPRGEACAKPRAEASHAEPVEASQALEHPSEEHASFVSLPRLLEDWMLRLGGCCAGTLPD